MGRRTMLLLTLVGAMLFACGGVVLAQTTTPDSSEESTPQESGTERPTTTRESATKQESSGRGKAPLQDRDPQNAVPGQYIVVLNDDEDTDEVAKEHKDKNGAGVQHVYKRALKGYAAK